MTKLSARIRAATAQGALLAALLLAVSAWLATPAAAEVYTVTLTSGKSFLTRYQPREATFDPALVTFMGEHGNLIAVPRDQIDKVTTSVESKGYGLRINTTTVLLGYTANNGEIQGDQVYVNDNDGNYDVQQFVEPSQAGGGFPVYGIQDNSAGPVFGGGGGGLTPPTSQGAPPPSSEPPPGGTVQ